MDYMYILIVTPYLEYRRCGLSDFTLNFSYSLFAPGESVAVHVLTMRQPGLLWLYVEG